MKSLELFYE